MSTKRIKPSKQGELDGACGFYSIVNALHLLEPELCKSELFTETLRSFLADGDPMRIVNGTSRGSVKNTLSRVIETFHSNYNFFDEKTDEPYQFSSHMPFWQRTKDRTRESVLDVLKQIDFKQGTVGIMGYHYSDGDSEYHHWTVLKKVCNEFLYTFDSSGEVKEISFDEVRVDSTQLKHSVRPFNIFSDDIFLISRV